jgi:hypothetical protein
MGRTLPFVKVLYIYSWHDVNQVDSNNLLLYFFIKWLYRFRAMLDLDEMLWSVLRRVKAVSI